MFYFEQTNYFQNRCQSDCSQKYNLVFHGSGKNNSVISSGELLIKIQKPSDFIRRL